MFDGVQINPRTADLPDTENLTAFQVAQLKTIARPIQARFDLLAESESLPVPTVLRTHRDDRNPPSPSIFSATRSRPKALPGWRTASPR